ncbi:MAG: alpha/beta fold hydrolase [Bacteroidetes bacterium]|nr:alpha/beta fold hydrolase [Bacteroidota bacterium]
MKLFYREYGKGQPIIILHGLFGLSDNWVSVANELSLNFKIIVPDLRNHGLSPHSSVMDYESMSQDLTELLEDLKIEDTILIGHSMGGKLAMKFALENSIKVKKLIVVDISPKKYPPHFLDVIQAFLSVDFNYANSRLKIDDQLKKVIESEKVRQLMMKNLFWKSKNCLGWKLNIDSIKKNLQNILEAITSKNIFDKPTLFLKGEFSDYILENDKKDIRLLFSSSKFVEIRNASHWVHSDSKIDFIKSVNLFLEA